MGHVRLRDLLVGKEGVARCKFGVSWHEDRGHDRGFHPLVMVGVDTHLHLLGCERELAYVERFELVMRLKSELNQCKKQISLQLQVSGQKQKDIVKVVERSPGDQATSTLDNILHVATPSYGTPVTFHQDSWGW